MAAFLLGINLLLGRKGTPTSVPPVVTFVPTFYILGF